MLQRPQRLGERSTKMSEYISSDRTSHFIDVGDTLIHALDWGGEGPPLILIHGASRTGRSWNAVARRLRDVFRVIAIDVRGHGDSGATLTGNDCPNRMRDIAKTIEHLNLDPQYVMAHSFGGAPAGLYASHYPGNVKALILIEPMVDIHIFWTRGETSKTDWANRVGTGRRNNWPSIQILKERIQVNAATKSWDPEVLNDILLEETRVFPDGHVEIKWDRSIYNLDEMWNDHTSLIEEAPRITMPTLVLARKDNPQFDNLLKPLADALPNGDIRILKELGHAMYMEDPGRISNIAKDFFLSQILPSNG